MTKMKATAILNNYFNKDTLDDNGETNVSVEHWNGGKHHEGGVHGKRPAKDFLGELKELSAEEKLELAHAAAPVLGVEVDES